MFPPTHFRAATICIYPRLYIVCIQNFRVSGPNPPRTKKMAKRIPPQDFDKGTLYVCIWFPRANFPPQDLFMLLGIKCHWCHNSIASNRRITQNIRLAWNPFVTEILAQTFSTDILYPWKFWHMEISYPVFVTVICWCRWHSGMGKLRHWDISPKIYFCTLDILSFWRGDILVIGKFV